MEQTAELQDSSKCQDDEDVCERTHYKKLKFHPVTCSPVLYSSFFLLFLSVLHLISSLLSSLVHSDPGNSLSRVSSSSSAADSSTKHLLQKKQHTSSSLLCNPHVSSYGPAPRSPSTLPRSYAAATGASSRDSQLDSLMMQHSEVERKKEVFLDHLRQKYPHHAAIIMGHQDHMMEQVRFEAVLCASAASVEQKHCGAGRC
ncbi:uncharacterized protein LOC130178737 [Seriola aureovittata]|uniref:uncharacterized protein LOC130178737 n=1 Tax=Seriola aureovittata TaxID=2871759 RepID=UPI0024BEFC46|nr:uncharacterized protein LOC130178737 [Seriola aureovittata]